MKAARKMVTIFGVYAAASTLTMIAYSPANSRMSNPDLTITNVLENGNTAIVTVRNNGTNFSAVCTLRSYYWSGSWKTMNNTTVGVLLPGATTNVIVNNSKVSAMNNRYFIDVNNAVSESNENNNIRETPGVQ